MKINIKGPIISSDNQWIYDWFGMEATSPKKVSDLIEKADGEDLEIEINSGGGSVFAGSEIYTTLNLQMSPTAQLMIHNSSTYTEGDYREMEHTAEFLKTVNNTIANAYRIKTGKSQEELLSLMDGETWMTANNALELGFIDEIMFEDEEINIVASTSNSKLIPSEVINKIKNELLKNDINNPSLSNSVTVDEDRFKNNNEEDEIMTLEELKEKHLDLYNQIFDEGKKEGIKTENERIKAIEDLGVPGFEDLVTKAKFENKDTAEKLAMDIIKAQKNLGKDYLDDLKKDAKDLDDVKGSEAPENKAEEKDVKEGASLIAKFANKKRGGKE